MRLDILIEVRILKTPSGKTFWKHWTFKYYVSRSLRAQVKWDISMDIYAQLEDPVHSHTSSRSDTSDQPQEVPIKPYETKPKFGAQRSINYWYISHLSVSPPIPVRLGTQYGTVNFVGLTKFNEKLPSPVLSSASSYMKLLGSTIANCAWYNLLTP